MPEILICHSPGDAASARRLADAAARGGYAVSLHDAPSGAVTDEIAAAGAAIVIWSEAASASEWIRAEANVARGLRKLIQVAADGRPPPVPFDPGQTVSILTWAGEEDHPAWRAIAASLAKLCGPPPEHSATAPPASVPAPPPAAPAQPRPAPARGASPLLLVLIVGLVLAALAGGAWVWTWDVAPETAPAGNAAAAPPAPAEPRPEAAAAPPAAADAAPGPAPPEPAPATFDRAAEVRAPAGTAVVRSAPSTLGLAVARVRSGETVATYAQTGEWWQVRTASGVTGYMAGSSLRLRDPVPAGAAPGQASRRPEAGRPERRAARRPRIRRENAAVMIAFCNGAGRDTPECLLFRRHSGD